MSIFKKTVAAAVMASVVAVSSVVPAQAQVRFGGDNYNNRDRVVGQLCERGEYRRNSDCIRWREGRWRDRDYDRFYNRNRGGLDNIASGLFGFTFGAIVGSAIANQNNNNSGYGNSSSYNAHVQACYARYRSYDERSDTYLNYDGNRYRCNL